MMAVEKLAAHLYTAERERRAIAPLTADKEFDVERAYATQQALLARKLRDGTHVVGRKIGLTSAAMQAQLGVSEPDFGFLLDTMLLQSGTTVPIGEFIAPRIEPEIAFFLSAALRGPGVTIADVVAATESVSASFEIIDSRIADWKIRLADTIADNASSSRVVLSANRCAIDDVDLENIRVQVRSDGQLVGEGHSSHVLGNPAAAVAWLSNRLSDYGIELAAGQLIMPGAMTAAIRVCSGARYTASFDVLGDVAVAFT